jgi:hypothetical protein
MRRIYSTKGQTPLARGEADPNATNSYCKAKNARNRSDNGTSRHDKSAGEVP